MPTRKGDCDAVSMVMGLAVFALPITLLMPNFSTINKIPKIRIERLHMFDLDLTWPQLHAVILVILVLFFCVYLEIRKRHLDEIVNNVRAVSEVTDNVIEGERSRQTEAMRACMQLLDSSVDHYEHLVLLKDDLRLRTKSQHPPVIELSSSEIFQTCSLEPLTAIPRDVVDAKEPIWH